MRKNIKGFIKFLWQKKYLMLIAMMFFGVMGYTIIRLVINPVNVNLSLRFASKNEILNYQDIISRDNLIEVTKQEKFAYVNYDYLLDNNQINIIYNNDIYEIIVKGKTFKSITSGNNYLQLLVKQINKDVTFYQIEELHKTNELIGLYLGSVMGLLFTKLLLLILYLKNGDIKYLDISDNEYIYKTPFHKSYWEKATNEYKKLENIIMVSILISLMQIVHLITLPSGFGTLGISFGYLFFAIAGMLYGPLVGIIVGCISDTVGFMLFPPGMPFNPLYTLSAMLTGLIYGLFFYKTKITFTKIFLARLLINIVINGILGAFWWGIDKNFTLDQTFVYMYTIALPKNVVYLLPQSILLYIVMKYLLPVFSTLNKVDKVIADNVSLL